MQETNQNFNIILPQVTCILIIILNVLFYILLTILKKKFNPIFLIYVLYHILIYIFIHNGISKKNYSNYSIAICLSLGFSISFTFFKLIVFIILLGIGVDKNNEVLPLYLFPIWIIFDWPLPIVLLCYIQKVKYICSLNNQIIILNNPLVQTNLIVTQNVNHNNNSNGPCVQPFIPNVNSNFQNNALNSPVQPYITNSNDNLNIQNLNAQSNIQNLDAPSIPIQNINNNEETYTGNI